MKKPFKETKVGKFLATKGFKTAISILGEAVPGAGIFNQVKDLVLGNDPEIKLSPEDISQFKELLAQDLAELDLVLKDVQNARDSNVRINESVESSRLVKMTPAIISLLFVLIGAVIIMLAVLGFIKSSEMLTGKVFDLVRDLLILIFGFWLGSSHGSQLKDRIMEKMAKDDN